MLGMILLITWLAAIVSPGALTANGLAGGESRPPQADTNTAGVIGTASLRSNEVNVRAGPGVRFPIKWVYRQKFIPLQVITKYDTWRKVRDWEGAEGWIHQAMLSSRRTVLVIVAVTKMRRQPRNDSPVVAHLARGITAKFDRCEVDWCLVEVAGRLGWTLKSTLWGQFE